MIDRKSRVYLTRDRRDAIVEALAELFDLAERLPAAARLAARECIARIERMVDPPKEA